MSSSLFGRKRNFIRAMTVFFMGFCAASCATQMNITQITADAKTTLASMDETQRSHHHFGDDILQTEDITEGVIKDYVALIDFLADRNKLRAKTLAPAVPFFSDTGQTFPRVVLFYIGKFKIDRNPNAPEYVEENCAAECARLLFEGRTQSVLTAKIDPHSLEVVPSSIREFRTTTDCSQSLSKPTYYPEVPALGLCLEKRTPKNGLELIEDDGLHVFGDRYHLTSPLAPKEFWVDSSKGLPYAGGGGPGEDVILLAYDRAVRVMKELEHVVANSDNDTIHRAIGIRANGRPMQYQMLFDYTCLRIKPNLPDATVRALIKQRAGKKALNKSWKEGKRLYYDEGTMCQGKKHYGHRGLFLRSYNGGLGFAAPLTPQELEDRLQATLQTAKSKGDDAVEWRALSNALELLRDYHPEYNERVFHRIEPIMMEVAKRDRGH